MFIRMGDVAVGLRFVTALEHRWKPVKMTWETDGKELGLQRLTCTQSDQGNHEGKAVTGLWIRAGENLDDKAFAAFRKDFAAAAETTTLHGEHLTITAAGEQGELAVGADIANLSRDVPRGGEPDWGKVVMAVNGHDYFADLVKDHGVGVPNLGRAGSPSQSICFWRTCLRRSTPQRKLARESQPYL